MLTTIWLNKSFIHEQVLPAGLFWSDVLGGMGYFERSSYLNTFPLSAIPQHLICDQYMTRWSFLYKRFTGVPTVCQMVFTTPGSLKSHSKIHTGATLCSRCSRKLATVGSLEGHMKSEHRNAYDTIWAPVLEIKDRGEHQDILGGPKSWRPKKGCRLCPNPTCYLVFLPNSVLKIIG